MKTWFQRLLFQIQTCTATPRSQILAYWADADVKRREAAALKISNEKSIKAKTGKEATDKAAVEATAAMKAMVGLCKLSPVYPSRLRASGFNH